MIAVSLNGDGYICDGSTPPACQEKGCSWEGRNFPNYKETGDNFFSGCALSQRPQSCFKTRPALHGEEPTGSRRMNDLLPVLNYLSLPPDH